MWGAIWLSEAQSELDVSHSHNAKQIPLPGGVPEGRGGLLDLKTSPHMDVAAS